MLTNEMGITAVVIHPINKNLNRGKLAALAKVVINNSFVITGIKIYEDVNGAFMNFPQEPKPFEQPTTSTLRTQITERVMAEYGLVTVIKKDKNPQDFTIPREVV